MSRSTQRKDVVVVEDFYDWQGQEVQLMYHGDEEVTVIVVRDEPNGLFFKRADKPEELLFVTWPRIKQVRGPAFWSPKPEPLAEAPSGPVKKKLKKDREPEMLDVEGGAA
jgi:hypothetical protein